MKKGNLALFIPHAGCKNRCSFCDQHRISGQIHMSSPDEIEESIQNCVNLPTHRANSTQIAFFGGSFTCIQKEKMLAYLEIAAPYVENGQFTGIRISTRPDGIDEEILKLLKHYHVNTIELGAQSMDPEVLYMANRGHTPEDTCNAAALIHRYGFTLGLQMLLGLPGDTKEKAFRTAQKLAELNPAEMRLYPAVVFPDTPLYDAYKKGEYKPLTVDEAVEWTVPIALYLEKQHIHLLKVGLHQAEGAVAGAFHPAFGELVRTGMWNEQLESFLPPPPCTVKIRIKPEKLSITLGQKRSNLRYWKERGYDLEITTDPHKPVTIELT